MHFISTGNPLLRLEVSINFRFTEDERGRRDSEGDVFGNTPLDLHLHSRNKSDWGGGFFSVVTR